MTVNHSVIVTFQRPLTDSEAREILKDAFAMKSEIKEIQHLRCGMDIGLSGEPNKSFSLTATFDGSESYKTYQSHPVHVQFITRHIKPLMSDRRAIQYEI